MDWQKRLAVGNHHKENEDPRIAKHSPAAVSFEIGFVEMKLCCTPTAPQAHRKLEKLLVAYGALYTFHDIATFPPAFA